VCSVRGVDSTVTVLIIIGVLVLFAVGAYYTRQQAKKRIAALHSLADRLGLQFSRGANSRHDERFAQFAIFRVGTSRTAYNTLSGTTTVGGQEQSVVMGDFRYTVESGSGKNRRRVTRRFSYVLVGVPHEGVPDVLLRKEHIFDRVTDFFGFDDIDFESVEFSRRFHVASSSKRFAWDLIDPRMMEFLMAEEAPVIDMEDGWICVADKKKWPADRFQEQLGFVGRFLDHWPDHVVRGIAEGQYKEQE
jgi:hypothetical protein